MLVYQTVRVFEYGKHLGFVVGSMASQQMCRTPPLVHVVSPTPRTANFKVPKRQRLGKFHQFLEVFSFQGVKFLGFTFCFLGGNFWEDISWDQLGTCATQTLKIPQSWKMDPCFREGSFQQYRYYGFSNRRQIQGTGKCRCFSPGTVQKPIGKNREGCGSPHPEAPPFSKNTQNIIQNITRHDAHYQTSRKKILQNSKAPRPYIFSGIPSMYGVYTYIYDKNQPNVGKYTSPMDPMGKASIVYPMSFLW